MTPDNSLIPLPSPTQLTAEQFRTLAAVPPENEWFANLGNKGTRRVYEPVIRNFMHLLVSPRHRNFAASPVPM